MFILLLPIPFLIRVSEVDSCFPPLRELRWWHFKSEPCVFSIDCVLISKKFPDLLFSTLPLF